MENSQITVNLLEEKLKNELNPEFCVITFLFYSY